MLIVQVLKRSAGIGALHAASTKLEEDIEDLTTTFMVLIDVTGFLEVSLPLSGVLTFVDEKIVC